MKNPPSKGFTLIELLLVMTIIVMLMGLLFSGLGKVRTNAKVNRTLSDLHALNSAIRSYRTEYEMWPGNYPHGLQAPRTWEAGTNAWPNNAELIKYLIPSNPPPINRLYNLKGHAFWEPGTNLTVIDAWLNPVRIALDPTNKILRIDSRGPDKAWGTADDIYVIDD
jgi:prepilin-type N-terminal cleavage/methylation domain-containing protein